MCLIRAIEGGTEKVNKIKCEVIDEGKSKDVKFITFVKKFLLVANDKSYVLVTLNVKNWCM
jgi:hypothetical protein